MTSYIYYILIGVVAYLVFFSGYLGDLFGGGTTA